MLQLESLPHEGGFFRRTCQADWSCAPAGLQRQEEGGSAPEEPRAGYSVIYALFTPEHFSALHRVAADEIWCFHAGDPLELWRLLPDGRGAPVVLGNDLLAGQQPQAVVRAGAWQAARVRPGGRWSLVTCVVSPEFRWEFFELGLRRELQQAYPAFAAEIANLTRG